MFVSRSPIHLPSITTRHETPISPASSIASLGFCAEPVSAEPASVVPATNNSFSTLVTTIHFLQKWAMRAEKYSDTKTKVLNKFKSDASMAEVTDKSEYVQVKSRLKLLKKHYFIIPAGNVLYWYNITSMYNQFDS